jgi:uncharacterized membrane protein YjjP (DUF1212 family)/uncharacterized membrane protein YjjB (DUF3815 family)
MEQTVPTRDLLRFLCRLGYALLATGEAVGVIEGALRRIARAHGAKHVHVIAFPTALFVKLDDGEQAHVDFSSGEGLVLRFDQMEAVAALAREAEQPGFLPAGGTARIEAILTQAAPLGALWVVLGHVLLTLGVALVLQPTVGTAGTATALGLVVGVLKLMARGGGLFNTLLPTIAAFTVTLIALEAELYGLPASTMAVLIASLVTFLPGGVLAVATMDLAYGDVVSGASRFVTGLVQLVFLVLGMLAAVSVIGLPPTKLASAVPLAAKLGDWGGPVGALLFGVGVVLHYSGRLATLPWVLSVLMIGAAGQAAGSAAFGGYLSGFIGALLITPAAYFIQYRLGGPPAMVTFLPALWLLVPSAIGLKGLAAFAADDSLAGLNDFVTTLFTIIATALGSLIGTWIYNAFFDPIFRRAGSMAVSVRQRLLGR